MTRNRTAWIALAVLFAINTLNFFDRLIIGAVAEPIRREFLLDDKTLGLLSTAFTLLYAFVGVPFGRLSDKYPRKWILAAGVFFWSLFTAGSGLARSFWQIFAARLGVGAAEASCAPAATSMIGDMFPAEQRGRAMSIFMLGLPIGISLSFAVSGAITKEYGWRSAFLIAGIPGFALAAITLLLSEPKRSKPSPDSEPASIAPYRAIFASGTVRWLILSGALHNFCLYALSFFLTPYLMRFHGLDIRAASLAAMVINGIVTIPGLLLGGFVGDAAKRRSPNGAMVVLSIAVLLSAPLFYLSLEVPAGRIGLFLFAMGAAFALMYFYYAIVYAAIQDAVPESVRGTAMSVYFMVMYVLGGAIGPYAIGAVSDHFTQKAAAAAGTEAAAGKFALEPFRSAGLHSAMYLVPFIALALAFVLFAAARSIRNAAGTDRHAS